MKKNILAIFLLIISISMLLFGCNRESSASEPDQFIKEVLCSNSVKSYYANVLDGEEQLVNLTDEQEKSLEDQLKNYKSKIKDGEAEISVLSGPSDSKYIRVGYYKKGTSIKNEKNINIFYVTKIDGKYKIDENINSSNPIDLITYESDSKRELTDFKVYAKLGSTYKYEFSDLKDEYYAIDIEQAAGSSVLYGYIKKDSDDGKRMYNLLNDGGTMQFTLSISVPDWIQVNRDIFLIDGVKAQGFATE